MPLRRFGLLALLTLVGIVAAACAPASSLPPAVSPAAASTTTFVSPLATAAPVATTFVSPVATAQAVTVTLPLLSGGADAVSYRDKLAGFEIDYPAGWSLTDLSAEVKALALGYSATLSSWRPEEAGGESIPEGGSKVDIGVTKGGAATAEQAIEARRGEIAAEEPRSEIVSEESWELAGGLAALRWTLQPAQGPTVYEVVTAIGGNRIVVSGLGDPAVFEAIARTLRPAPSAQARPPQAATPTAATPGGETAPSATAAPRAGEVYTVRRGDTLAKIAAAAGTTVKAILAANPQITSPDRIAAGQRITIPAPVSAATTSVQIYLISIGDGSVGCGDGVVAVRRDVAGTRAVLSTALEELLAQDSQYYGESGLYNALYQSDLAVERLTQNGTDWTIRLQGSLLLGGVCDGPRVKAQLEQTARQFSTVGSVHFYVNGKTLESLISGR